MYIESIFLVCTVYIQIMLFIPAQAVAGFGDGRERQGCKLPVQFFLHLCVLCILCDDEPPPAWTERLVFHGQQ